MTEVLQSNPVEEMTVEASLTPEQLCSLGLSEAPPDALTYCLRHGLQQYLLAALTLIRQCFSSVHACRLRLEQDPEAGEEWLVLEVALQEDVEKVLAGCDAYTDRWVAQVPWPECDKIRLVYNVL
jgi:hypothetical protein